MHLQCGRRRLARIYVERMSRSLHNFDERGYPMKFRLRLTSKHNPLVYAELLAVAAEISMANGNYLHALDELEEASNLDPQNLRITRSLKSCEKGRQDQLKGRKLDSERKEIREKRAFHSMYFRFFSTTFLSRSSYARRLDINKSGTMLMMVANNSNSSNSLSPCH